MAAKLYTFPKNPRALLIQIVAKYTGAPLEVISEPPQFKLGETNKTDDFKAKFPFQKVPALVTADGQPLYETNAIAAYVASFDESFTPKDKYQQALVQQFVNVADHEIYPASCVWVYPTLGIIQFNKAAYDKAKEDITRVLAVLNGILAERTFLVGERVSLADIAVVCALLQLFEKVVDTALRGNFPHVARWFLTCVNQPNFQSVLGAVTLCEKEAQFDGKAFAALSAKKEGGAKKEEKKEKKEEKKKEDKPKEEKPKEKKEEKKPKKEEEDEDEDDGTREEKIKIPLDTLPPSTFDLDAFKRAYSNLETTEALKYLWEHFDAQGYSIWKADYMYPEDLTKIFMTSNLVGGMFQRIEKMRKYAFGSVCVFGEENNNVISGLWIWRGQELIFNLVSDWNVDAPSYKFEKLDPSSEATKEMVKEYFSWEGKFPQVGKPFAVGKIFK